MNSLLSILLVFVGILVPFAGVFGFLDRKMGADLQARVGPNRAGRFGMLQPVADLLKLFQKNTEKTLSRAEVGWLLLMTAGLYASVAALPLGTGFLAIDADMGAIIPILSVAVVALSILHLGAAEGQLLSGIRFSAQALSGLFPALVSFLALVVSTGHLRWSEFALNQGFFPTDWNLFQNPFCVLAFLIFLVSGLVLFSVPPLDGAFSLDLNGGVASRLSGVTLSFFKLGRFYALFLWVCITVVLFCGAWTLPMDLGEGVAIAELLWLVSKVLLLMLIVAWLGRVNPRVRVDQVTDFTWRVLAPLALLALAGAVIWGGGSTG